MLKRSHITPRCTFVSSHLTYALKLQINWQQRGNLVFKETNKYQPNNYGGIRSNRNERISDLIYFLISISVTSVNFILFSALHLNPLEESFKCHDNRLQLCNCTEMYWCQMYEFHYFNQWLLSDSVIFQRNRAVLTQEAFISYFPVPFHCASEWSECLGKSATDKGGR